ncbi:MAG: hypothetical protein PHP57_01745 [Sideroxydans sp.]|nr:hypothetical protein [Sideroxydans sp.]
MDKTVKIQTYTDPIKNSVSPDQQMKDRLAALELEHKHAQLEEERVKNLELLKNIVQLRESLKQEQAKSAAQESKVTQLEAQLKQFAALEEEQAEKLKEQLEEEKKYSLTLMRTIEQLKEEVSVEKKRSVELADSGIQLESKLHEIQALEAKVNELKTVLGNIADTAKMASNK